MSHSIPQAAVTAQVTAGKKCHQCNTRTNSTDPRNGEPLCALCLLDRQPKRADDAGWSQTISRVEEEE